MDKRSKQNELKSRGSVDTLQTDTETTTHIIMECDVIPTSPQEVDPLGNVENCNGLDGDDTGVLYSQTLNATLIASADHDGDVVDSVPKSGSSSRKIIDIAPPKTRKMLTIRRASLPAIRATNVTEASLSHGIVNRDFFIFSELCSIRQFDCVEFSFSFAFSEITKAVAAEEGCWWRRASGIDDA